MKNQVIRQNIKKVYLNKNKAGDFDENFVNCFIAVIDSALYGSCLQNV